MIIEWILQLCNVILDAILSLLGVLPDFSPEVTGVIDQFFDFIFNNGIGIVDMFIGINFIKVMIPVVIAVINFDHIYSLVMWIINKIPFLGMD